MISGNDAIAGLDTVAPTMPVRFLIGMIARRNSEEDDICKYISEVQFVLPDNTWTNADIHLPVRLWADSIRVRVQELAPLSLPRKLEEPCCLGHVAGKTYDLSKTEGNNQYCYRACFAMSASLSIS